MTLTLAEYICVILSKSHRAVQIQKMWCLKLSAHLTGLVTTTLYTRHSEPIQLISGLLS